MGNGESNTQGNDGESSLPIGRPEDLMQSLGDIKSGSETFKVSQLNQEEKSNSANLVDPLTLIESDGMTYRSGELDKSPIRAFPCSSTITGSILGTGQMDGSSMDFDSDDLRNHPFLLHHWASMTDSMSEEGLTRYLSADAAPQVVPSMPLNDPLLVGASRDLLHRWSENRVAADRFRQEVDNYLDHFGIDKTFITIKDNDDSTLRYSATSPEEIHNTYDKKAAATKSQTLDFDWVKEFASSAESDHIRPEPTELTDEQIKSIPVDENNNPTSIGSISHGTGECRPCAFNKNPKKSGCSNGISCTFCHFEHPKRKKPPRPSKHQRILRKLLQTSAPNIIQDRCNTTDPPNDLLANYLTDFKTESFEFPVYRLPTDSSSDLSRSNTAGLSLLSLINGPKLDEDSPLLDPRTPDMTTPDYPNGYPPVVIPSPTECTDKSPSQVIYVLSGGGANGLSPLLYSQSPVHIVLQGSPGLGPSPWPQVVPPPPPPPPVQPPPPSQRWIGLGGQTVDEI